jgi:uncharacterized SAM-binding protein YcdF (DUF218 family)
MFFILSKTVTVLLQPSNLILSIGLLGLLLLATRFRRAGRLLAIVSLILLLVAGLFPFGNVLSHVLERRFPPWDPARGAPDGIVVLGGAILPKLSLDYGVPAVSGDAGRILAIARLARAYPKARIIYTGGDPSLLGNKPAEAQFLMPLLDDFGIARDRVTLESRSRNTAENAVYSKEIAQPKPGERWLLVTSAQHMPRAVGCFRRVGFAVEAYPVAWHLGRKVSFWPSLRIAGNLSRLDGAANAWLGLFAYWLTGRTSALLPSP